MKNFYEKHKYFNERGETTTVIRKLKERHWHRAYSQITTYGKGAPLSLQFDMDINCNGVDYVLKVQPSSGRKLVALQAMGVYPDSEITGNKDYHLIEDNAMLSALLEIIIYQGASKRK